MLHTHLAIAESQNSDASGSIGFSRGNQFSNGGEDSNLNDFNNFDSEDDAFADGESPEQFRGGSSRSGAGTQQSSNEDSGFRNSRGGQSQGDQNLETFENERSRLGASSQSFINNGADQDGSDGDFGFTNESPSRASISQNNQDDRGSTQSTPNRPQNSQTSANDICAPSRIHPEITTGNKTVNTGNGLAMDMIKYLAAPGRGPCQSPPACDSSPLADMPTMVVDDRDHNLLKNSSANITVLTSNFADNSTMNRLLALVASTYNNTNKPQSAQYQEKKYQKKQHLGTITQNWATDEVMVSLMSGKVDCGSIHVLITMTDLDQPNPKDLIWCEILKASIDIIMSTATAALALLAPETLFADLGLDFLAMAAPVPCPGGGFLRRRELHGITSGR